MQEQLLQVRGLPTAYLAHKFDTDNSKAPIIFFIHGFPDDPWVWRAQFKYFVEQAQATPAQAPYAVVAPWGRGLGGSAEGINKQRFKPSAVLLDHLAILREVDAKKQRKIIVVGHDIGSVYAWNLAQALGEQLAGLAIINGLNGHQIWQRWFHQYSQLAKSWYIGLFQVPLIPEKIWQAFEPKIMQKLHEVGGYPLVKEASEATAPQDFSIGINWYRAALKEFIWEHLLFKNQHTLTPLKVPVLALSGNQDPFVNPMSMDEMEPFCEQPEVRVIQAGHWPQLEKAKQVNRILGNFVDKVM